jgi:hypothetical protein
MEQMHLFGISAAATFDVEGSMALRQIDEVYFQA